MLLDSHWISVQFFNCRHIITFLFTLQEHQSILTNATVSKDSDFHFMMVAYENFFKNILKYLKEMKKYVSKLILHEIL